MISIDAGLSVNPYLCKEGCPAFIEKWTPWIQSHHRGNLALINVQSPNQYFHDILDAKSRNMIRKARKNYVYKRFDYNAYLNDIYKINTSREIRQGKPMSDSYITPPKAIGSVPELCVTHRHVWVGGFKDNELLAYCSLIVLQDIAIINTVLGHDKALTYGIMNGLIESLLWNAFTAGCKWLNYLDLDNCTDSMARFKKSVGFKSYEVEFV